jgi:hypothetical protein
VSVDEVNALIPELERIFARIRELEREVVSRANELERAGAPAGSPSANSAIAERRARLDAARSELEAAIRRIRALGGIVQDLSAGLVDFHHVLEGQDVFLCWQVGEARVAHFHAVQAGLTARHPLPFNPA